MTVENILAELRQKIVGGYWVNSLALLTYLNSDNVNFDYALMEYESKVEMTFKINGYYILFDIDSKFDRIVVERVSAL